MIHKDSPIPLYHQIKQDVKAKIKSNKFPVNQPIPSENELTTLYNVSRMTVRLAIQELEKEGYVKKIQGKGTFVKRRKLTQELNKITSWSETVCSQGMIAETKVLKTAEIYASEELADQMQIVPGTKLYSIERIKSVEGEPIGISHIYVVAALVPGLIYDPGIEYSVYEVMEKKYNVELNTALEIVSARAAGDEEALRLNIKSGDPLIHVFRITYDALGKTVELSEITSRADMYQYRVMLHGRNRPHSDIGVR